MRKPAFLKYFKNHRQRDTVFGTLPRNLNDEQIKSMLDYAEREATELQVLAETETSTSQLVIRAQAVSETVQTLKTSGNITLWRIGKHHLDQIEQITNKVDGASDTVRQRREDPDFGL